MADYTTQIEELHKRLNAPENVPEKWYRPSVPQYTMLCYVNTIIGLYYSANYDAIPIFICRAHKERESYWVHKTVNGFLPKKEVWEQMEKYLALLNSYLSVMTHFLEEHELISDSMKEYLPEEFRVNHAE